MKNITDVKKEISSIENLSQVDIDEMKGATWRRLKKKLALLRLLINYLETNPTEEFVKSEIARIEKTVSNKMDEWDKEREVYVSKGVVAKEINKLKNKYESMYDLKKMRTQVRNLRILIK